jgi:3-oxoacyl-[acyl-carrier-protein] synthase II
MKASPGSRRVVITGLGVISPSGNDLAAFWSNVSRGLSAAGPVTRFDVSKLPTKIAAEVKNFDGAQFFKTKKPGRFELTVQYSVAAATLAVGDAGVDFNLMNSERACVIEGTTLSGAHSVVQVASTYANAEQSYRALHPYNVIGGYCGEGSSTISLMLGIRGYAMTYCSGCASGNDAIGHAFRSVQNDEADVAVAGGTEELHELLHVGFCRIRSMSVRNDSPATAVRPFDRNRDGFILGEGAVFLVLEEMDHALQRGARIYAEVLGYGKSAEAYHATDPHPEGWGVRSRAEKSAG